MSPADDTAAARAHRGEAEVVDWLDVPGAAADSDRHRSRKSIWPARRTPVRARCTLLNMRLDETSRTLVRLRELLAGEEISVFAPEAPALQVVEGALFVARDALEAAHRVLNSLADLRPHIAILLQSVPGHRDQPSPAPRRALSPRELSILRLIARGMSNKRIAQSLGITPETVKSHAKNIFVKLASRTRAQAVSRAEAIGLL